MINNNDYFVLLYVYPTDNNIAIVSSISIVVYSMKIFILSANNYDLILK